MAPFSIKENIFIKGKNFWISYNPMTDTGLDETALCQDKTPQYIILNGNYLDELKPLVKRGYDKCFKKISELVENGTAEFSKWSE